MAGLLVKSSAGSGRSRAGLFETRERTKKKVSKAIFISLKTTR